MNRFRRYRAAVFASLAVVAGLSWPAAAEDYVLAVSKAHSLRILAEGGADAWCSENVRLRMVLDAGSPDLGNEAAQIAMMNRLKTPISNDCKAATSADLTVVEPEKPEAAYRATASGGWVFAAVASPAASSVGASASADAQSTSPSPSPAPAGAAVEAQASEAQASGAPSSVVPAQPAEPSALAPVVEGQAGEGQPVMDYWLALLFWLKNNPAFARDDEILRLWAFHENPDAYNAVRNQEFKLQPLLQKAGDDIAEAVKKTDFDHVKVAVNAVFGIYVPETQGFLLTASVDDMFFVPCCGFRKAPGVFMTSLKELDLIRSLPMKPDAARSFEERRTNYGNVDRSLRVVATVGLTYSGTSPDGRDGGVIRGTIQNAVVYGDEKMTEPVFSFDAGDIARWQEEKEKEKADAAKEQARIQAEKHREQFMAERDENMKELASASQSIRMMNFISTGELNYRRELDNIRNARAWALLDEEPIEVAMLVQASSSGRKQVETKWPGVLRVTVPDGQPELKSSQWYLVQGTFSVPDTDGLPDAELVASDIYACTQAECAEAADPAAIMDRKTALMLKAQ